MKPIRTPGTELNIRLVAMSFARFFSRLSLDSSFERVSSNLGRIPELDTFITGAYYESYHKEGYYAAAGKTDS